MRLVRVWGVSGAILLAPLFVGSASAGSLEVSPVTMEIAPDARGATFSVTNHSDGASGVQIRGYSWTQTATEDPLTPTDELTISPPVFRLEKNESQTVRLILRAARGTSETTYRLLVDELPAENEPTTIHFTLRLSLPIFAEPARVGTADVAWKLVPDANGGFDLFGNNRGARRQRLAEMALSLGDGGKVTLGNLPTPYILAGTERHWHVTLPAGAALKPGQTLHLGAIGDTGRIDVSVPVEAH